MNPLTRFLLAHLARQPVTVHLYGPLGRDVRGGGYGPQSVLGKLTPTGIEYPAVTFAFNGPADTVHGFKAFLAGIELVKKDREEPFPILGEGDAVTVSLAGQVS